jgi:hypothetical protein
MPVASCSACAQPVPSPSSSRPSGQQVDGGRLPCQQHGVVQRVVQHQLPHAQRRGGIGRADQRRERIDDAEMIGHLQRAVAERLDLAGEVLPLPS